VDGLDEYRGDQADVVELFNEITADPRIKAVVSSRPESLFSVSFKSLPMLQMETLTREDMVTYVIGKLESHPRMLQITERKARFLEDFAQDVSSLSCGVFLWTALAVKLLLETLDGGCFEHELRKVLFRYPRELDKLYRHMFDRMKTEYRVEAFQILRCVQQARQVEGSIPSLFRFWFWMSTTPGSSILSESHLLDRATFRENLEIAADRIKSRLCGLLEVTWKDAQDDYFEGEVYPFHRTISEFLEEPSIIQVMERETSGFDSGEHLLSSILWCLKSKWFYRIRKLRDWQNLKAKLRFAITYMQGLGDEDSRQTEYLDAFDRVMTKLWIAKSKETRTKTLENYNQHWSQVLVESADMSSEPHPLVRFAFHYKLYQAARNKIATEFLRWDDSWESIFTDILRSEMDPVEQSGRLMESIKRVASLSTQFTSPISLDHVLPTQSPWEILLHLQPLQLDPLAHPDETSQAGSNYEPLVLAFEKWVGLVKLFVEFGWSLDHYCSSRDCARTTLPASTLIQDAIHDARKMQGLTGTGHDKILSAIEALLQYVKEDTGAKVEPFHEYRESDDEPAKPTLKSGTTSISVRRKRSRNSAKMKAKSSKPKKQASTATTSVDSHSNGSRQSDDGTNRETPRCDTCKAVRKLSSAGFTATEIIDAIDNSGVCSDPSALATWIVDRQEKAMEIGKLESKLTHKHKTPGNNHATPPWSLVASRGQRIEKKQEVPGACYETASARPRSGSKKPPPKQRRSGVIETGKRSITWSTNAGPPLTSEEEDLIRDILAAAH